GPWLVRQNRAAPGWPGQADHDGIGVRRLSDAAGDLLCAGHRHASSGKLHADTARLPKRNPRVCRTLWDLLKNDGQEGRTFACGVRLEQAPPMGFLEFLKPAKGLPGAAYRTLREHLLPVCR
ncbi:MAG: hypothetical protein ACYDDA_10565, partial [Acidiferrobacteraceae bacterium]